MFRLCASPIISFWQVSLVCILGCQAGCQHGETPSTGQRVRTGEAPPAALFELKAERFESGGDITEEFACDAVNASPGLCHILANAELTGFYSRRTSKSPK
jgi:hypothetical protein